MKGRQRGRGADGKGRSKRDAPFVKLDHGLLNSEAFAHVTPQACKLLIGIWRRHDGRNNGAIPYSRREAMKLLQCGEHRAAGAFDELIDKGFIKLARNASFSLKTREAREWELTAEQCNGDPPSRDFKHWRSAQKQNTGAVGAPHRCCESTRNPQIQANNDPTGAVRAPVKHLLQVPTGAEGAPLINIPDRGQRMSDEKTHDLRRSARLDRKKSHFSMKKFEREVFNPVQRAFFGAAILNALIIHHEQEAAA
ncbi:hypothetical protein JCM17846_28930 [Iodidimonas nitroreducens]|uniref:Uncharacterized protein n=1 Tax=Iodidimonas nitroreducens TaxID=1236968 RepID=A0A5A7NA16_9PROT|nr:hypothetical protein [Iodidimonas nitroreducens]GAK34607.1 hypothetical protein AQ1_02506 [alpha proteobacterium Q-1]GER05211.1 hypothetical protein JCM17846_28930 [Iodidimonas nitroreducens]